MKNLILTCLVIITTAIVVYSSEYEVPKKTASVDVADIDLDGDLDIVLGHIVDGVGGLVTILVNNGKGEFTLIDTLTTGAYETSIQIGNINNNPTPDIVFLDYHQSSSSTAFSVSYDYGLVAFDSIVQYPLYEQIIIWDYLVNYLTNNDYEDIVFISHISEVMGILYNNGNGEFSEPEYFDLGNRPNDMAVGDLNGDERDDIVIGGGFRIFYNYPTHFEEVFINLPIPPFHILIEDVDNDGKNDIIGTDWGMPGTQKRILIYRNEGNDNFQLIYNSWIEEAMAEIFAADLNNDTYIDIIYNVSIYSPNSNYELFHTYILFNNGDGTYEEPVDYYTGICSHRSIAADLDGDGWKDIITLNYDVCSPPPDTGTIHILFNDRTGHFVEDPVTGIEDEEITAEEFKLYQNYPNPFNPTTRIKFTSPSPSQGEGTGVRSRWVTLKVYDVLGKEVATLVNEERSQGEYEVNFDGTGLASGLYFYQLKAGDFISTKKMVLLR